MMVLKHFTAQRENRKLYDIIIVPEHAYFFSFHSLNQFSHFRKPLYEHYAKRGVRRAKVLGGSDTNTSYFKVFTWCDP
jgi:hypothetical protein